MIDLKYKILLVSIFLTFSLPVLNAQKLIPFKLPDTGQIGNYTTTSGEDSDFIINPMSFTNNGDGTITDNNTGLMWQKTDGGEMTFENASAYCQNLSLGGFNDWRLPTNHELFSLNNFMHLNPALDTSYFTKTLAEYWWTGDVQVGDATKVWAVNAGGGTGNHPKSETVSAGGTKKFHVRAVRNPFSTTFSVSHFTDNGNGTITDNFTGLVWQKIQSATTMAWEDALAYARTFSLAGKSDWRLPNVKELQSLNDEKLSKPSFDKKYFPNVSSGNFWSSTTMFNKTTVAWDINIDFGVVSYSDKITKENVLLVRGGMDNQDLNFAEVQITGGDFDMGDHFGFVDPGHPSDETPIHKVKVNSFNMSKYETTNQQFLAFLNSYLLRGLIEVRNNIVYAKESNDIYYYTNQYASYYSIGYNGQTFVISDFRANHPVVGVMWSGAVAFCNWLSSQNGLDECYNLTTYSCDFAKNGYRLPTEAEWEYAGRGGNISTYLNYPLGNSIDISGANLPDSKDPYEGTIAQYPFTTPVGFYDGKLHLKSEYNWLGSATNYQTADGKNGFGLYDMQGNVWEFVNDWYGQNYYSVSPYDNPKGPDSTFKMPDGKPYRGMRGGNWYNGLVTNGVNDGHSRVSNRNPSYYRGPQDPNHPYYHLGFRVARQYANLTGINDNTIPQENQFFQNYPNPFHETTNIQFSLAKTENVSLQVYNSLGQLLVNLEHEQLGNGTYNYQWNAQSFPSGIYSCKLQIGNEIFSKQMILIK